MQNCRQQCGPGIFLGLIAVFGAASVFAGPATTARRESVSSTGNRPRLQGVYATELTALQTEISRALPVLSEQKKAAFNHAREAEMAAIVALNKAQQASLNKKAGNKSELAQAMKSAEAALERAQANGAKAAAALLADVAPFLASDKLDAKLVKATVLATCAPPGSGQEPLLRQLLADAALMKQMLIAGGAEGGQYGRAMEIYTAIQKASPKAKEGVLQRLALAVALEHAEPVGQKNAEAKPSAPKVVDPVKRYLHYEKAYLDGELDPAFRTLTVWELRMVVNSDAPDEVLAWGREMLRNYRPDHIRNANYGWRYSATVKTEVKYGGEKEYPDDPALEFYQNIIKTGGVCGRRAFFGRFILRAFGIPTWGVTQHAHAALSHWTPNGWVVNLGAGFRWSWWDKDGAPRSGNDFLLETQARVNEKDYLKVLRAQWINAVLGQPAYNDRSGVAGGFWSAVAHYVAKAIAEAGPVKELGPLGQDIAEANHSKEADEIEAVNVSETNKKITVAPNGVITIPAVACTEPTHSTKTIVFMKSYGGDGMQLHWNRLGSEETFAYTVNAPRAGRYALTAKVVTVNAEQQLLVLPNQATAPVVMPMPYTKGMWQTTAPVPINLVAGPNTLRFTRKAPFRGLTIKEFTLTPIR